MKKLILFSVLVCSIFLFSNICRPQQPVWEWAKSAGGPGYADEASAVAVDAYGNVYAAGYFLSLTINFGTTVLTNVAFEDIFLVKYDYSGNVLWAKSFGGDYDERARALAVDAAGNVLMAGIFASSTLTFGSTTLVLAGNTDLFVTKFDSAGNVLWAKSAGGTGGDYTTGVAAGPSGSIFISGDFSSPSITFGSVTLANPGVFLVRYNSDGSVAWARGSGGENSALSEGVSVDAAGNSYASGEYWADTIIFSPVTLVNTKAGAGDVYLVKYNPAGDVLWAKSTGGFGNDYAQAVAVDGAGNASVGGTFHSSWIIFDSVTLVNPDSAVHTGIFLARYDPNGNVLWARKGDAQYDDQTGAVAVDGSGNSYIAGNFNCDTIRFGPVKLANTVPYYTDIFIAKYDAGGNILWATHASGADNEDTYTITCDPAGNVYTGGFYRGTTVTFGNTVITNQGWWDLFVAKLGSTNVGVQGPAGSSTIPGISVFPNPATDKVNILLPGKSAIEILTPDGRVIKSIPHAEIRMTLDMNGFPGGVYLIKATTADGILTGKFVKQ